MVLVALLCQPARADDRDLDARLKELQQTVQRQQAQLRVFPRLAEEYSLVVSIEDPQTEPVFAGFLSYQHEWTGRSLLQLHAVYIDQPDLFPDAECSLWS